MNKISKLLFLVWAVLLCVNCVGADALSDKIDSLLAAPELSRGIQGVVVASLKTGNVLYERNANTWEIPASNTKLFTAATALDALGPEFTYTTAVYASGKVDAKGVLRGSITIKGGGDPVLDVADLDAMAVQMRHSGIKKIAGNIIVDDSMFDNIRLGEGWSWDYLPDYYAAEISALNVHENIVDVYICPAKKVGPGVEVRLSPAASRMIVKNYASTAARGSAKTISVKREAFANIITISGAIALDERPVKPAEQIAVKDPHIMAAGVLREQLAKHGVVVVGKVLEGKLPAGAKLVSSHTSPPLSKIISLFLKPSDNLIGEVLLKTVGLVIGVRGSAAAGLEAESKFLGSIGIDPSSVSLVDGSGLSRYNQATPRSIVALLTSMASHKNSQLFISALPIAGVDGTLKTRMLGTPAQGNVRAKTGTLRHASCLSGYATSATGEPLVFSIMMNNHSDNTVDRKVQDEICVALTSKY